MACVSITDHIVWLDRTLQARSSAGRGLAALEALMATKAKPRPASKQAKPRSVLERMTPLLRADAPARYEVRLTRGVRAAIERELLEIYWAAGQRRVETAGQLFGHQRPRHAYADVCYASGPGPNSRHGSDSVTFATAEVIRDGFPDWLSPDLKPCGDWHSQPSRHSLPSPVDQRNWAHQMEEQGWDRHVSLIVTQGADGAGWEHPDFHAWVTRRHYEPATGQRDGYVTEPAWIYQEE